MKQSVFIIRNMDCPTEEALIRKRLGSVSGVAELAFNLVERRLTVTHTLADELPILGALRAVGMEAVPAVPVRSQSWSGEVGSTVQGVADRVAERPAVPGRTWMLMAVSGVTALAAEILAWTGADETSPAVVALALLSIATGGFGTLKKAWIALETLTLNMNFLMSIATIGAVAIGEWPEAAVVIFLFALAELIETLSLERAKNAIRGLMAMTPEIAMVRLDNGEWTELAAAEVQVGQTVRVKPGERIPLDGVVTAGASAVNQAPITGESIPVEKALGDLRKLPAFIALSRATSRVLWQNISLGLGIKVVFFALALTGTATLWMAVFADMGASLLVVGNGLRLLTMSIEPKARP